MVQSQSQSQLQEVLLSSSPALTCIHDLKTGALLTSFKAASTGGSEISSNLKDGSNASSSSSSQFRKTVDVVEASDGQGGLVVSAVPGKAAITIWSFQREAPLQRLITPTKVACLALSKDGSYLAVGGHDGRVFLWELSSGSLLASFDAHYRAVTCLAWTDDGAALISASDDSAAHVWSLPVMLASPDNPLLPVTPYSSLTDHTLPITSLHTSFGSFPRTRILTGSLDGTIKLWDLTLARSKAASSTLLSTFSVGSSNEQITHVTLDSLERTIFVACREPKSGRSRVVRVDLYRRLRKGEQEEEDVQDDEQQEDEANVSERWEALGGGGRGDIVRLDGAGRVPSQASDSATQTNDRVSIPGRTYNLPSTSSSENTITTLHLSSLSSTLIVGTSSGHLQILALPSLQPIRTIVPLAGTTSSSVPSGAQTLNFVKTFLKPLDLISRSGGGGKNAGDEIQPRSVAGQLSRTIVQSGSNASAVVNIKLNGLSGDEVEDLIEPPTWSSITPQRRTSVVNAPNDNAHSQQGLQEENARLREQLARSIAMNDRLWEGLVDGVLGRNGIKDARGRDGMQIDG